jgi:hypothetical protein
MSTDDTFRFYPDDDEEPSLDDGFIEDEELAEEDEFLTDAEVAAIFDNQTTLEPFEPVNPWENYSGDINRPHHGT